jgi:RimJ/RimL family protein N-acetyltransferase
MRGFPEMLKTDRLTLHLIDVERARVDHQMVLESLDHLWPWFGFRAKPPTLVERTELAARHRAQAEAGTGATYLLYAGDRAVGKVWFDIDGSTATMGWWLRASATGRGYAVEAVRRLTALAFESGVERIEAHTDPDNSASRSLAERAGFVLEEIRPDAEDRPDGVRRPNCVYVLLKNTPGGRG